MPTDPNQCVIIVTKPDDTKRIVKLYTTENSKVIDL